MNTQISIIDGTYSVIHIPLDVYSALLQPILRTLLPQSQTVRVTSDGPDFHPDGLCDGQHGFLNISVTPLECTVVCHQSWAHNVFQPVISALPKPLTKQVSISKDSYIVLSVIGADMDAGSRVVELTSPLAVAGIPIFFITTYYSDFICVPAKERHKVNAALLANGFRLDADDASSYLPPAYPHPSPPASTTHLSAPASPPRTPPPSSVHELVTRTFDLLRKRAVAPYAEPDVQLVQCSGRDTAHASAELLGRRASSMGRGWIDAADTALYAGIVSALVSQPRFCSVTLAQQDPPSLLLDRKLLPFFGGALVGDFEAVLVPIFLDLATLPAEVTGIVCGVAGRLLSDLELESTSELSYLSTAKAGSVILSEEQAKKALEILGPLFETR
ncbi:hypothetical protein TD95_002186 [Thielaviopsis punctulata]|uniref:CASTOR ACT domain-containing protein n=1 Tax=Thielaviopsis punctulata TaxID=72032 RepID=A0A0F4ZET5_9PEZI|nr:hypothetical protein TD95_002186 [Thielaviopsis punctulata]